MTSSAHRAGRRAWIAAVFGLMLSLAATPLAAQVDCGEYLGLVCEGLLTDEPNVTTQREQIESEIMRVTDTHGNPLAFAISNDARGMDPVDFAVGVANAWGVGDPSEENGIFVLVTIAERRTEVVTQANVDLPGQAIANAARPFFQAGDFDGGILAMIGAIDTSLAGGTVEGESDGFNYLLIGIVALGVIGVAVYAIVANRRQKREEEQRTRARRIRRALAQLEPRGDEIDMITPFRIAAPAPPGVATETAIRALLEVNSGRFANASADALVALLSAEAAVAIDVDEMRASTQAPIELVVSGEESILEAGVEGATEAARNVPLNDDDAFEVAMDELDELVLSLRPFRIAAARERAADALEDRLVDTPVGAVVPSHLGTLVLKSSPVLDGEAPFAQSAQEVRTSYEIARTKVGRLEVLRGKMAISDTRDVASVALADMTGDPDTSIALYSNTLHKLKQVGTPLTNDGVPLPAVAALLTVNNTVDDIDAFVDGYATLRRSHDKVESLEGALAGLYTSKELDAASRTAKKVGLPVSIAVALTRRRDDGIEVYRDLLGRLDDVASDEDAKVIAGVLAMSLEPSVALEAWRETRAALGALGLHGSYADVAAAFGASDPRGPYAFALAFAAQRAELEEAGYASLTRYAPELAHAGTSGRRDSWTGTPIGGLPMEFDPFTFFYLHWAASGGRAGGTGWGGLYSSPSWQDGGSTWWGGGDGFGGSGGSSWGSSWSGGSGSFGGFSGGGGFGGSGGGGW